MSRSLVGQSELILLLLMPTSAIFQESHKYLENRVPSKALNARFYRQYLQHVSLSGPLQGPGHALVPARASVLCRSLLKCVTHNPQHCSGGLMIASPLTGSAWHLYSCIPSWGLGCDRDGEKTLDQGQQQCHDLAVCSWALWEADIFGVDFLPLHNIIVTGRTV